MTVVTENLLYGEKLLKALNSFLLVTKIDKISKRGYCLYKAYCLNSQ